MYDIKFNSILAFIGGICSYLFGGFDIMLQTFLIFVLADLITGIIKGSKGLSSEKLYFGIMKKAGMFVVIFICVQMDKVLNLEVLRSACVAFYIGNEGLSILENLGTIGVPIPKFISDKLAVLKKESEESPE